MKKILFTLLTLGTIIFTASCDNPKTKDSTQLSTSQRIQQIDTISYVDSLNEDVEISYPQVVLENKEKQELLNTLLKDKAFSLLNEYAGYGDFKVAYMQVDSEITFENDRIVSVCYRSDSFVEKTAHPNAMLMSNNIELDSLNEIALEDIILIDDYFIDVLIRNADLELRSKGIDMSVVYSRDQVVDLFHDEWNSVIYYLTPDRLCVGLMVPHVLGDWLRIEIPYNEISDNINENYKEYLTGTTLSE